MTAHAKLGTARLRFARLTALTATIAMPTAGLLLVITGATSASASEPAAFAASTVPFSSGITASALMNTDAPKDPIAQQKYEPIGSGRASYYGRELAGNRTASGERFNPLELTAAHRSLPLGTNVRVTNAKTGNSVIVRINDRGPFHSNRLIDLSEAAARKIGIRAAGSGIVELAIRSD